MDFPDGSHEHMIHSIHTKLLTLPDDTAVYPGHGAKTTIGEERRENPWL
jgi:glyoxylase-like metal-dependent hydrolase (beta-lactamase superfamily II)